MGLVPREQDFCEKARFVVQQVISPRFGARIGGGGKFLVSERDSGPRGGFAPCVCVCGKVHRGQSRLWSNASWRKVCGV